MDKEMEKAIDKLSNEVCTYNINAIGYPNVIVLREDVKINKMSLPNKKKNKR